MFGIEAIEIYFPKTFVDQRAYENYLKQGQKYTKGLGQDKLSFCQNFQDINSISLTVVNNLLNNYKIDPKSVGRLQVGTETIQDKSKSVKTVLMDLFKENPDIQGVTSLNACYGGTNALINTLNWMSSEYWDGRYGIVVCADIAVYNKGAARATGGAGAIALLIGPNGKITFDQQRASFMKNQWDFYKPDPHNEYPTVDGKLSVESYTMAAVNCYQRLCQKVNAKTSLIESTDFFCFHTPFNKMIQKAFRSLVKSENPHASEEEISCKFDKKVKPSTFLPKNIGNTYTGSLFFSLTSLLVEQNTGANGKSCLLFSYGSGLCSSLLRVNIKSNPLDEQSIANILERLNSRIQIPPEFFEQQMAQRQENYGNLNKTTESLNINGELLFDNSFFLESIDSQWRRTYGLNIKGLKIGIEKENVAVERLQRIQSAFLGTQNSSIQREKQVTPHCHKKFGDLNVEERLQYIVTTKNQSKNETCEKDMIGNLRKELDLDIANTMIQNVIGTLQLPLAIVPKLVINKADSYIVPMSTEEPSVVAACSSSSKFISENAVNSFETASTDSLMIGQVHIKNVTVDQIFKLNDSRHQILNFLNEKCPSMNKRGGGVKEISFRQLGEPVSDFKRSEYSVDISVNVCDSMGANTINTLCEHLKDILRQMGISTGIAILSNYCFERRSKSCFEIPISKLGWKGKTGSQMADGIIEAWRFASIDKFRAVTHNKGIMNGISAVCLATGQDWRAIQATCHAYASHSGQYQPLTRYSLVKKQLQNGEEETFLRGEMQVPISVGTVGGVLSKNPQYKAIMALLNNPTSKELAEVMVSVGLAQNFAALRALVSEGIQKGHMRLHNRAEVRRPVEKL